MVKEFTTNSFGRAVDMGRAPITNLSLVISGVTLLMAIVIAALRTQGAIAAGDTRVREHVDEEVKEVSNVIPDFVAAQASQKGALDLLIQRDQFQGKQLDDIKKEVDAIKKDVSGTRDSVLRIEQQLLSEER